MENNKIICRLLLICLSHAKMNLTQKIAVFKPNQFFKKDNDIKVVAMKYNEAIE